MFSFILGRNCEKELEEPIEIFKDDNLDLEEEINLEKKELENQIKTSSLSSWRISKGLSSLKISIGSSNSFSSISHSSSS